MAAKEEFRAKTNVWSVLAGSMLLVVVVEVFLYFFIREARDLLSDMNTGHYVYMVVAPLLAIAERIYIPAIIEAVGIDRVLLLVLVVLSIYMYHSVVELKKTVPTREVSGHRYFGLENGFSPGPLSDGRKPRRD